MANKDVKRPHRRHWRKRKSKIQSHNFNCQIPSNAAFTSTCIFLNDSCNNDFHTHSSRNQKGHGDVLCSYGHCWLLKPRPASLPKRRLVTNVSKCSRCVVVTVIKIWQLTHWRPRRVRLFPSARVATRIRAASVDDDDGTLDRVFHSFDSARICSKRPSACKQPCRTLFEELLPFKVPEEAWPCWHSGDDTLVVVPSGSITNHKPAISCPKLKQAIKWHNVRWIW